MAKTRSTFILYFLALVLTLSLISCTASEPLEAESPSQLPPSNFLFSFVVIADPHVTGDADSENAQRLTDSVEWINATFEEKNIEMAVIVGDLAWADGLGTAKNILDNLTIPYLPIIGDNVIQRGGEIDFVDTFSPQFNSLASIFDNWQKAATPVYNPDVDASSYFQNFSFDYKGVHFMAIDWCSRVIGGMAGERADLHEFSHGTWPWFVQDLVAANQEIAENIIIFTHHPMHVSPVFPIEYAAFSPQEDNFLEGFIAQYGDNVYANFAGHYHIAWSESRGLGQYQLFVIEAMHLARNTIRLVKVSSDSLTFSYEQEIVEVP